MKGYISYDGKGVMRFRSENFKLDLRFSVPCNIHHIKKITSYKKGRLTLKLACAYGQQPVEDITETYDLKKMAKMLKDSHRHLLKKIGKVRIEGYMETIEDYEIGRFCKNGTAYARVFSPYTNDSGILFTDGDFQLISTGWGMDGVERIRKKLVNRANGVETSEDDFLFDRREF